MSSPHASDPTVAVVVPMYEPELAPDEAISLRHLDRFLSGYERILAVPETFEVRLNGFQVCRFPDRFFTSINAYSALLLSRPFYEAFADYDYILIYQTDALVFSDQLREWCAAGYDYLGAPWPKWKHAPERGL